MPRANLLRSTPFRLALAFALIFICAVLLSGVLALHLIHNELNARYDSRISEAFRVIAQTDADSDVQDLIDAASEHIAATTGRQNIFLLQDRSGRILAANVPQLHLPEGWSDRSGKALGIGGDRTYRIFKGSVGENMLVVGTSNEETTQLEEIVLGSFGWTLLVVFALAVGGGALIAARAERRLDAVRGTMERVAHGELSARIPLLGNGDDIDLLSRDINDALGRLSATVEGMRQVSTDIAHDLKTPLNRLKLTLEGALSHQTGGESSKRQLEAASEEADQINQTFEALLRIAQIESGARKSRFKQVDLREVLDSLTEVYRVVAEDRGQILAMASHSGPPIEVVGDRDLLVQLYANLIENALRHCPAGSRIGLCLTVGKETTVATVEDNGPGIPAQERERVFRRLYRLEKSRTSPGTGLGLSLVRAIVDLHGGEIRLEDAGPGLRVITIFPRAVSVHQA